MFELDPLTPPRVKTARSLCSAHSIHPSIYLACRQESDVVRACVREREREMAFSLRASPVSINLEYNSRRPPRAHCTASSISSLLLLPLQLRVGILLLI